MACHCTDELEEKNTSCGCSHDHTHEHEHHHEHDHEPSCSCCSEDEHEHGEEEEDIKGKIEQMVFSALWLIFAIVLTINVSFDPIFQLLIFLPAYLAAGHEVLIGALRSILHGRPFSESFLMSIATIGALVIAFIPGGQPEFAEAVFVMLFYQIGELFEDIASDRSRRSIKALMDIRPDSATILRDGKGETVAAKDIALGEVMIIAAGDKVALDGEIIEGTSSLDTSALTGESVPRDYSVGDTVLSGAVNLTGTLKVRTTSTYQNSTAAKILQLVEGASSNKSNSERFITKFARIYTPIVVFAAIALILIGSAVSGDFEANFASWLLRGLTFLIVSCPCALVVSVPLSFFGGIGAASRQGVLIKGSNYLEALSRAETVTFDKTGTLTQGKFAVRVVHTQNLSQDELLHLAAHVEAHSKHPIAEALRVAFPEAQADTDTCMVEDTQELAGKGIIATVNGQKVAVGNMRLMEEVVGNVDTCCKDAEGTIIHVAIDGEYAGHIICEDVIKEDTPKAIAELKELGIKKTVMLSGDLTPVAEKVAAELGVSEVKAELLPQDKVAAFESLLPKDAAIQKGTTLYVGDGINDAPVLARADVGVAMGGVGSDAAIEAADVVLMDDSLLKLAKAIRLAKRTMRIAKQNIYMALGVKFAILVLAAFGLAPMWLAVFGDTGVLILCVLNATRTLKVK